MVVVLAGGGSRRLGQDKLAVPLADSTVLEHLLSGLHELLPTLPVVLVGPPRPVATPITQVREVPAGGGPVAALARALQVPAARSAALIGLLAGDQPFAAPALAHLLSHRATLERGAVKPAPQALLAVDPAGHRQPLLGLYNAAALRTAVGADPGAGLGAGLNIDPAGRSMRSVLAQLQVAELSMPAEWTLDVDTLDDVDRVRLVAARGGAQRAGTRVEQQHETRHQDG